MKKTITRLSSLSVVALMLFAACDSRHAAQPADSDADTTITEAIADSSVYGIVGEVITDVGDTLEFVLADADTDVPTVLGGLLAGDRVAVVSHTADGEQVADKVVNITSLLGKWTSIDKSFEIREGGIVESTVKAETNHRGNSTMATSSLTPTLSRLMCSVPTLYAWRPPTASSLTRDNNNRPWNHSEFISSVAVAPHQH